MNLITVQNQANKLLEKYNLYNWSFSFDRSITRFGCCNYSKREISMSKTLTLANNDKQVTDTLLHEIAHALCDPSDGHNRTWQQKAKSIGCNGSRCYSSEDVVQPVAPKLTGTCPTCNKKTFRYRAMKVGKVISCGKCDSVFNKKHIIVWSK